MRTGIITFHFANNFGAVLQTFALKRYLDKTFPGNTTDIIPYCKSSFKFGEATTEEEERLLRGKYGKFRDFLRKECGLTGADREDLSGLPAYDCYVSGSDQIWNTGFASFSENYLLSFAPAGAMKVAYASSIGTGPGQSDRLCEEPYRRWLPEYDRISIRESGQKAFVESVSGKVCEVVVDPTLLLDRQEYEKLLPERKKDCGYVLLFWLDHDNKLMQGIDLANLIALTRGLKVVHGFQKMPDCLIANCAGSIYYGGVEDFLWYVKNAEIVVTNSYHATIFSMIFRRPFYTFTVDSMRSRMDTLKDLYGIGNRCVDGFLPSDQISFNVNYSAIEQEIESCRKKSFAYLCSIFGIQGEMLK